MTERMCYDPEAGPWVAFREWPNPRVPGRMVRAYRWGTSGIGYTSNPADANRYDTKAEALASVAGPRLKGQRRVAHRVDDVPPRD